MQIILSAGFILLIVLWGIVAPASMAAVFDVLLAAFTRNFGWFYLWLVLGLVIFAFFVAFSRYGDLKLGGEDDEPEFSMGSWFALLFAAGMGIGLVFYGVAEPVSHWADPPPGVAPRTADSAGAAMRYVFFHWGVHPWAVFGVVALSIAFFHYRRGEVALISSATSSLPWRPVRALSGVFDGLAVVATAFGVAASLGVGALQINSGLHKTLGIAISAPWQVGLIAATTVVFLLSAVSGVDKGVKLLSNFNLILAAILALVVFVLGPTVAIIDTFTTTLGSYLSEIIRMSLRAAPFSGSGWVGTWTIFYWAWWISWSPFVGLFIARVSRGRTIREFILGTVLAPSLAAFLWFSIFGGSALFMQIWQQVPLADAVRADVATALFTLFDALPLGGVMSVVAIFLVLIFVVTSGDSAVLVLGIMSTRGNPEPPTRIKIVWGVLIAGIAISLLLAGGLKAVQTATIVFALPFAFVIILMTVALWRAMRDDWKAENRREREIRRRVREMMSK
ncbi:BCCT family transporter [Massilia sp. TN1-12]|uniref:BCCT family transporter n=1 Tax=Massilia paldalensis TaxID=3377675 RepID=UPI00384FE2DD